MNRIDRLTAILIQLQTKRVVKAEEIADRFEISLRTVYRDVKALMEAGVPIGSEAGKGYFIVDGYHLPPVMFNEDEASAMLLAGKLVEKMTDVSIRNAFESALYKIKSVLREAEKDHLENLQLAVHVADRKQESEFSNHFLTDIQRAVVQKDVLQIEYQAGYTEELTVRELEPIGLFYYSASWHLIAWCRMRNDYRDFRADRIKSLTNTGKKFENKNLLSLQEYYKKMTETNHDVEEVVVLMDKSVARHFNEQKYMHGFISQTDLGNQVRMVFLVGYMNYFARWLLSLGTTIDIEKPDTLKTNIINLLEELQNHYKTPIASDQL
jgi:predicted DNA-binding transcriptional regulator YafY